MSRALLLLALAALALAILPAVATASPRQAMTFEAPRELLDDAKRDATLDEIRGFGVDRIRQLIPWRSLAPRPTGRTRPSGFDGANPAAYGEAPWGPWDRLIAAAKARGIRVQLTVTGPAPRWGSRTKDRLGLEKPDAREFGRFATAVGRRYAADVDTWSIWNEPNQPQFLLPQYVNRRPASGKLYRGLYRAAHRGLRATQGNAQDAILIGETSPRGNENVVAPLAFLRDALCLSTRYRKRAGCGRLDADGYAHHAYTTSVGPRFRPEERDDVTIGVLSRLVTALDRAGAAGALPRGLGIYLTEFGVQSTPDTISGVSLAKQPEYYAISERIAYLNPRVRLFSQYLMADDLPREEGYKFSGFETGLRRSDGREKPAYAGFPLPLAAYDYGSSDVLWGRVRPSGGQTTVKIDVRRRGSRAWRAVGQVQTNAIGVYGLRTQHREGNRYRAVWARPGGGELVGPAIRAY